MAKYRKKPVVIDAVLNTGEWDPIMAWLDEISGGEFKVPFGSRPPVTRNEDGTLEIETLEGTHTCNVGDYLLMGVAGEFYPCKPDIFAQTYEAVTDGKG